MADHSILGYGGMDVDMVTGRPRIKDPSEKESEAVSRLNETVSNALDLLAELKQGSPGLRITVEKYVERLSEIAKGDTFCQAYESIIHAYRHDIEVAPLIAQDRVRKLAGPSLSHFLNMEVQPPLKGFRPE